MININYLEYLYIIFDSITFIIKVFFYIILSIIELFLPKQLKNVRGENVLITGGGHGIGRELALVYASKGATVIIWDINKENAEGTVKEIANRGYSQAYAYVCDVSNRTEVFLLAKKTQEKIGNVTILVNNAGIMPNHLLLDHTEDEIKKLININLMAHFWTLQAFLPTMIEHNYGHIVALCSSAGVAGFENLVPYCASKFAVRGLMESLRVELNLNKSNQIKLTNICPYMVNTGLCKNPKIRFKNIMPLLEPEWVAQEIVKAQCSNTIEITLPKYLLWLNNIIRLMPITVENLLRRFLGVSLDSDI